MAPKKGNQWWRRRSRHGIELTFKTPELMWEGAAEYFEAAEKDIITVGNERKNRPFSMEALCIFLGVNTAYFRQFEARIAAGEIKNGNDFSTVINTIKEIIKIQQRDGAITGKYKENIISRMLGLHDHTSIQHSGAIDMPAPIIQVNTSGTPLASKESDVEVPEDKKEGGV